MVRTQISLVLCVHRSLSFCAYTDLSRFVRTQISLVLRVRRSHSFCAYADLTRFVRTQFSLVLCVRRSHAFCAYADIPRFVRKQISRDVRSLVTYVDLFLCRISVTSVDLFLSDLLSRTYLLLCKISCRVLRSLVMSDLYILVTLPNTTNLQIKNELTLNNTTNLQNNGYVRLLP